MSSTPQDDPPDGFSAAELFAQGASRVSCRTSAWCRQHVLAPCAAPAADWRCCAPSGVSYTYDDCIFHPGHIFFSADEARTAARHSPHVGAAAASPLPPPPRSAAPRAARAVSGRLLCRCCPRVPAPNRADPRAAGVPASARLALLPGGPHDARDAQHRAAHAARVVAHGHRCAPQRPQSGASLALGAAATRKPLFAAQRCLSRASQ